MKTKDVLKKMWYGGQIRNFVLVLIFGTVLYLTNGVKYEKVWCDFHLEIEIPQKVLTDTTESWWKDTLKNDRYISVGKLRGDSIIAVVSHDFRDAAKISLAHPTYQKENLWLHGLAMGVFPSNSGDRWEISLEQEDGKYYLTCERLLVTQTYVGKIFGTGIFLGLLILSLVNMIFPQKKPETQKKEE